VSGDHYDDDYDEYEDGDGDRYRDEGRPRADTDLPNPYAVPEVEELLEEAIEILAEARPLPMSTTVKVNRDELLHLLERAQERLPEELRAARWLLKERDDFVARARQEHQDLIDEGRAQVGRMVERQEIVKAAELRARQIVGEAKDEANNLKRQVEDYCDQRLASFEQILSRTSATVQKGRERLMATARANTEEIMHAAGSHRVEDIDLTGRDGNGSRSDRRDLIDEEL
jgi:cell division septum initiation protein DivIVA